MSAIGLINWPIESTSIRLLYEEMEVLVREIASHDVRFSERDSDKE